MSGPILPGATIGIFGSGQLGRMLALAARRMGYRIHTYSPDVDSPTGQVADREVSADYGDEDAVRDFVRRVDVVTFEFENVPSATVETAARYVPVRPSGAVLHTTQHRLREKSFLQRAGFPIAPFRAVGSPDEVRAALSELGSPAVLKTAGFGYDGKGQATLAAPDEVEAGLAALRGSAPGAVDAVLEAFVDFDRELSVVAARGSDGAVAAYGVFENRHHKHILDVTTAPATVPPAVAAQALDIARGIVEALEVVGVLCVELFLTRDGQLLVNELAPRVHNSGHLTFDACVTSQFEQQVRAVCGLPLGATDLLRPAAMANLLGDLWEQGEPDWAAACRFPEVKLHLYGKAVPRPGRKMGHLTALATTADQARARALAARAALVSGTSHT